MALSKNRNVRSTPQITRKHCYAYIKANTTVTLMFDHYFVTISTMNLFKIVVPHSLLYLFYTKVALSFIGTIFYIFYIVIFLLNISAIHTPTIMHVRLNCAPLNCVLNSPFCWYNLCVSQSLQTKLGHCRFSVVTRQIFLCWN